MHTHIDPPEIIPCSTPHGNGFVDITGQRFGQWMVVKLAGRKPTTRGKHRLLWLCRCACGNSGYLTSGTLRFGASKSCGCNRVEVALKNFRTHGKTGSPEHVSWKAMHTRCVNPNQPEWHRYGGRGIKMCDRWRKFENFLADMGQKPTPSHQLDRINTDGDYAPDNCRWATTVEQQRNKTSNHNLTFRGETKCISAWSEELSIPFRRISDRINRGWMVERALTEPPRAIRSGPSCNVK